MSDVTGWVGRRLAEQGYSSTVVTPPVLDVLRDGRPPARVYCAGLNDEQEFGRRDVESVMGESPSAQFIVVVPTRIADSAYVAAEELGVCCAGFGELLAALDEDDDVATHVDSQEQYERRRFSRHPAIVSIERCGRHAYRIGRASLPPLTIVTTDQYEFTVDEFYGLLESHDELDIDLIVVTNPNCRGLSTESRAAARNTGVNVVIMNDFLAELDGRWT